MSAIGKIYPSEKRSFKDPETQAEIVQYTALGEVNRTLYFTNRPFVCDGERIVFLSDRTGRNELFTVHRESGRITQVTDVPGQPNVSACLHPHRSELYFHNRKSIFRVNLDSLETEELLRAPDEFHIGILNLNSPPWLAFEMIEKKSGISTIKDSRVIGPASRQDIRLRPLTLIYRFNIDDGQAECVWSDYAALSHVQISPTDPNFLIFSDSCLIGRDRIQYLDLRCQTKQRARPLLEEPFHARAGHECFSRRGNLFMQWMEGGVRTGDDFTLWHAFKDTSEVPLEKVEDAKFRKYIIPEKVGYMHHHFTMSYDEKWGVHDRWPVAPTFEMNESWISIFFHTEAEPQTRFTKVCFQNASRGDKLHLGAELTLDNTDQRALYTSFLGDTANVCEVYLAPFLERR